MAAYDFGSVSLNLGTSDRPNPVNGMHATADFFSVFGVSPLLGRTFSPEEDLPNAGKFAVLTFNTWKNRLGEDRDIVGKPIILSGEQYVVLGVLPKTISRIHPPISTFPRNSIPTARIRGTSITWLGGFGPAHPLRRLRLSWQSSPINSVQPTRTSWTSWRP